MEKEKKVSVSVTMTQKLLKYLRDKKPDHMTRSCYLEDMFWRGVELLEMRKNGQDI